MNVVVSILASFIERYQSQIAVEVTGILEQED